MADRYRSRHILALSTIMSALLLFPAAAVAQSAEEITPDMVQSAARLAGLRMAEEERQKVAEALNRPEGLVAQYDRTGAWIRGFLADPDRFG